MSSELQRTDEPRLKDLSPEYAEIMVLGKVLHASGYFKDVRDQAQAVTKILYGRELGISPINSMSGIHIIEGKPALSSNLLAALIKRSGKYDYRIKVSTDTQCSLMFLQKVGNVWEEVGLSEFSIEDAKRAGVIRAGGSWSKFPKAMLFARALSQGERMFCPDVSISPLYVPEELGADVNESGEVVSVPSKSSDVARTTKPIPISSPAIQAAADPGGNGLLPLKAAEAQKGEGTPAGAQPPPMREPGSDDGDEESKPLIAALEKSISKAAGLAKETIAAEPGMVANFAKSFRESLPRERQKDQNALRHEWLTMNFFMDENGNPTSEMIPKKEFEKWKAVACKWAATVSQ